MKIEKQIIMVVQAAPKTQPGGVHGALFSSVYQSDETPEVVVNPPIANAAKFSAKKRIILSPIVFNLMRYKLLIKKLKFIFIH